MDLSNSRISPALTASERYCGMRCPRRLAEKSAPVTTIIIFSENKKCPPMTVISSAAAFSGLPTSRFPIRSETGSAAPEAETPITPNPGRPRSWTVVKRPGLMTRLVLMQWRTLETFPRRLERRPHGRQSPKNSSLPLRGEKAESAFGQSAANHPALRWDRRPSGCHRSQRCPQALVCEAKRDAGFLTLPEVHRDRRSQERNP